MVSAPLLTTKVKIPPRIDNLITRPQLLQKMAAGLQAGSLLTLVSAPPGYGKTLLIREWLAALAQDQTAAQLDPAAGSDSPGAAWLTLDAGDNDLVRFVTYLNAALQPIGSHLGQDMLAALHGRRRPAAETLATLLINDLAGIPHRVILVLDDYHAITEQSVHELVAFLVDHQPPNLCLIIATRADPPLPLIRLRARRQLVELRQEDLAFTPAETAEFLSRTLDMDLTSAQLVALTSRTEGWPAGLQLAALSMPQVDYFSTFIDNLTGEHAHIADYLTGEVLAQQSESRQAFLLQTAILERLCASLCEAVTQQAGAQQFLEELQEANLFLIPQDDQREWYRYHALLADLLRKRLYQTRAEEVPQLHQRASRWYEENGLFAPAIEHALAAPDIPRAAALIAQGAEAMLMRQESVTLLQWLAALPPEQMAARPILRVYQGLALLIGGKPLGTLPSELETTTHSPEAADIQGEIATLQALVTLMAGDSSAAIQHSDDALAQLPPERSFFRSLAADGLGMAYTMQGDLTAATQAFEQVVDITVRTQDVMMTLMALSNLAGLRFMRGQLHTAAAAYQQVITLATERLGDRALMTGKAWLGLGEIAREWNDLEGALQHYSVATDILAKSVEIGLPIAYLSIARAKSNQADWEGAYKYLEKARLLAQESTATPLDDRLTEGLQVRFWIARGELELATHWAYERGLLDRSTGGARPVEADAVGPSELGVVDQLLLARLFLAQGKLEQALQILTPLRATFEAQGQLRRVIEVLTLEALAYQHQGSLKTAWPLLDRALRLAAPEGYQRTFLDEGEPMVRLLYRAAERDDSSPYLRELLTAFANEPAPQLSLLEAGESGDLVEPLSPRELEVLTLIAQGCSNREIAARLYIAPSTVKGHTAHIYGKLNVKNRTQAVARARQLGILLGS